MNTRKTACEYKELVKTNFESSLSVGGCFPLGTCSLEEVLGKPNLKWEDYLQMNKADCEKWEKKANELDMSILFVFGCASNKIQKNLKHMSAYAEDRYPQNIKTACNIYSTQ